MLNKSSQRRSGVKGFLLVLIVVTAAFVILIFFNANEPAFLTAVHLVNSDKEHGPRLQAAGSVSNDRAILSAVQLPEVTDTAYSVQSSAAVGEILHQSSIKSSAISAMRIAAKYKLTPVLLEGKTKNHLEETFAIQPAPFMASEVAASLSWSKLQSACCCCHEPQLFEPLSDQSKNFTVLVGLCLESWKYFDEIRDTVRRSFAFKQHITEAAQKTLAYVKRERCAKYLNCLVIGVHNRRGDYLGPWYRQHGHLVVDADYFHRAMSFMTSKFPVHHLVFACISEDQAWLEHNLVANVSFGQFDIIVLPTGKRDVDLWFISITDHVIMSVGTFAWWGAYLGNGTVVYSRSVARPGSAYAKEAVVADMMPPDWIGL